LFSFVFRDGLSGAEERAFVDALELFEIGYSWVGTTNQAVAYNLNHTRNASPYADRLVRLSIGMEETSDLIADLKQALARMQDGNSSSSKSTGPIHSAGRAAVRRSLRVE
jgi:cysteine-S-conjugate beta-lyase